MPCVFTLLTGVHNQHVSCLQLVCHVFTICSPFSRVFTISLSHVFSLCVMCLQFVHLFHGCSQSAYLMSSACAPCVYNLFTFFTGVHNQLISCLLFANGILPCTFGIYDLMRAVIALLWCSIKLIVYCIHLCTICLQFVYLSNYCSPSFYFVFNSCMQFLPFVYLSSWCSPSIYFIYSVVRAVSCKFQHALVIADIDKR